tara:strand:+ start:472 stop:684 length:213 start_codon:yes stop_codon:yes gene_type:complete
VPTHKTKLISVARQNCANWDRGNCLGIMFSRRDGALEFKISKEFENKPCCVNKGCSYFDNIVIPGVNNGY